MLNYLFHLMFWPDKDLKTIDNVAMFKLTTKLRHYGYGLLRIVPAIAKIMFTAQAAMMVLMYERVGE